MWNIINKKANITEQIIKENIKVAHIFSFMSIIVLHYFAPDLCINCTVSPLF